MSTHVLKKDAHGNVGLTEVKMGAASAPPTALMERLAAEAANAKQLSPAMQKFLASQNKDR